MAAWHNGIETCIYWVLNDTSYIASDNKSKQLFISNLSKDQKEEFELFNKIRVVGCDTKNVYIIECYHTTYNIKLKDKCLCFGPGGELPLFDRLLAQKIALECFENEALKVANYKTNMDLYIVRFEWIERGSRPQQ